MVPPEKQMDSPKLARKVKGSVLQRIFDLRKKGAEIPLKEKPRKGPWIQEFFDWPPKGHEIVYVYGDESVWRVTLPAEELVSHLPQDCRQIASSAAPYILWFLMIFGSLFGLLTLGWWGLGLPIKTALIVSGMLSPFSLFVSLIACVIVQKPFQPRPYWVVRRNKRRDGAGYAIGGIGFESLPPMVETINKETLAQEILDATNGRGRELAEKVMALEGMNLSPSKNGEKAGPNLKLNHDAAFFDSIMEGIPERMRIRLGYRDKNYKALQVGGLITIAVCLVITTVLLILVTQKSPTAPAPENSQSATRTK